MAGFDPNNILQNAEQQAKDKADSAIDELAFFALRQGRPERALRLGGAALAVRRAVGASLHNSERTTLEKRLDAARKHLGEAAAAAEAEGRSMTIESAVDYALRVARGATRS